jgi:hypothetical protein
VLLMKKAGWKKGLVVCMFMFALALVFACAKPPTQEIADAQNAIADAKAKETDLYAHDAFTLAQDELKQANALAAAKKYDEAKKAALEAIKTAQQAASRVEENKQEMKTELEAMLPNIQKALDETKKLAASAVKKKAASKEEVQTALESFDLGIKSVNERLQAGKIREASDLAKLVSDKINAEKQTLTDAMAQQKPVKKK